MDPNYRVMIDFLRGLGTESVPHSGDHGFLAHLVGVFRDLEEWGAEQHVCRAGLFHSIYGTELFKRFSLPLARRDEVKSLIGERAEWLAYVNCVMDRSTLDALVDSDGPYQLRARDSGETLELTPAEYEDLVRLHLCDWLEQVPRSQKWEYRRDAYRAMARRLGGVAQESYDRVFALAPALSGS